jgi:hypothetical protein
MRLTKYMLRVHLGNTMSQNVSDFPSTDLHERIDMRNHPRSTKSQTQEWSVRHKSPAPQRTLFSLTPLAYQKASNACLHLRTQAIFSDNAKTTSSHLLNR